MAVQEAIALSPFERRGVHARYTSLDMERIARAARLLGFVELADRVEHVSTEASEGRLDDEAILRLCLWTPEMWARHDAEPLEGVD